MRVAAIDAPSFCFFNKFAQFTGGVAQKLLQVTDELVDKSFAVHFADHIPVVVISQSSARIVTKLK